MSPRVRLIFRSLSEIVGNGDIGLLVLTDSAEQRQVVMPCDRHSLKEFARRIDQGAESERLLPEVLWSVLRWQTDLRMEIHIDYLYEEQYQAVLANVDTLEELPIDLPDAVMLSYISRGDIPVMMDQQLFRRQSTVYDSEAIGVQLPVNTISNEMLQTQLDKAVDNENYEVASQLRDELKRREKAKRGNINDESGQHHLPDESDATDLPDSPDRSGPTHPAAPDNPLQS
jgi:hypothetical protein